MRLNAVLLVSFILTALATGAGLAHLYELSNKLPLAAGAYRTVQQIYRGWSLLGIAVIGGLISTFILTFMLRNRPAFPYALTAFLCMAGAQIVFWTFTFPVNLATKNWTVLPQNWPALRGRWVYSHASGAMLDLAALILLFLVAMTKGSET